jgi:3-phosphoshikimate 1-carboxyvinyltransferase
MGSVEIKTLDRLFAEVEAPPSKAHTLRAIVISALADGCSVIASPLIAEDQEDAIDSLRKLGVRIDVDKNINVYGVNGSLHPISEEVDIGGSGLTARLLTVIGALANRRFVINGNERMQTGRPIKDLIDAINCLGIYANSLRGNGCVPIEVKPGFEGGQTTLNGGISSQYFTAIMIAAPYAKKQVTIITQGDLVSKPYIDITIQMMEYFGVQVDKDGYKRFTIPSGQQYHARNYTVEGDYSSAAFFFEAAAITQGRVRVNNLNPSSVQGDKYFVSLLRQMGCEVNVGSDWVEVVGKPLKGIRADMRDYPDIVTPLAVTAAFANGISEFYNIGHLLYKESNRLTAPVVELRKMGIDALCTEDSLVVNGGKPHGAEIDTHSDHRMVMGFAPAGLKIPGITIRNPENVGKSFPDFFERFNQLY